MKTTVVIKEVRTITVKEAKGFRFIDSYICEIHRKDGSVKVMELRKAQLVDLYKQADQKGNIEFVVDMEELEDADLIIEAYSVDEYEAGEFDVYLQTFNFSADVDYRGVVSSEKSFTFNKREFNRFRKANKNQCWI